MRDINDNYVGYDGLGIAIVKKAVWDYRQASKRKAHDSEYLKCDVEWFFKSKYCREITGIDGRKVLSLLQEEVK